MGIAPLNGALWEGGGKSFIFKGTNGRWKGVLSDRQNAAYERKLLELPPDCATWLETGRLPQAGTVYGTPHYVVQGAPMGYVAAPQVMTYAAAPGMISTGASVQATMMAPSTPMSG